MYHYILKYSWRINNNIDTVDIATPTMFKYNKKNMRIHIELKKLLLKKFNNKNGLTFGMAFSWISIKIPMAATIIKAINNLPFVLLFPFFWFFFFFGKVYMGIE